MMLDWIRDHPHLFGWVIVTLAITLAFYQNFLLSERLERESIARTHNLCVTQNETRGILVNLLEFLAEARDDDEPGDYERRQEQLALVVELLQPVECPPPPP